MTARAPAFILGGLPIIAEVYYSRSWEGEYDAEVQAIYWQRNDGTIGKEIPQHLYDKAEAADPYFSTVIETVGEHLSYLQYKKEEDADIAAELGDNELLQLIRLQESNYERPVQTPRRLVHPADGKSAAPR